MVACVASASVGFPARSRHFPLFGGAKILALAPIFARPKSEKCLERAGKPTETPATPDRLVEETGAGGEGGGVGWR